MSAGFRSDKMQKITRQEFLNISSNTKIKTLANFMKLEAPSSCDLGYESVSNFR